MTRRRAALGAVAVAALAWCSACTGDEPPSSAAPSSPAAEAAPATSLPAPAGEEEVRLLAGLPEGPATGTVVLTYTGVGELRSPFTGACEQTDGGTVITATADTASIRVESSAEGVSLDLQDVGFAATSVLAVGQYSVTGDHLTVSAPLVQSGQVVGSAALDGDCGG